MSPVRHRRAQRAAVCGWHLSACAAGTGAKRVLLASRARSHSVTNLNVCSAPRQNRHCSQRSYRTGFFLRQKIS